MKELIQTLNTSEVLLADQTIIDQILLLKPSADKVVANCIINRYSVPCMSEAVNFFNALITAKSTANLIQAQRDYFGAHTYQRIDADETQHYHTNWK
jgi:6-phosphogluconate dehydrogenase